MHSLTKAGNDSIVGVLAMSSRFDISHLLRDWDYLPGQVVARRFKGRDGTEKLQLRVDLGLLQMNAVGRPDGKRPRGRESWFEVYRYQLEQWKEAHQGSDDDFTLNAAECARLQQESIQYHHRYICWFQLGDYDGVERDCDRNSQVYQFAANFAKTEELAWSLLQFVPQMLMMRTRARGTAFLRKNQWNLALEAIREGLEELEAFYRDNHREESIEHSGEMASLRGWMEDVRQKRPLTERETLERQLGEAIDSEDYETAARLRDQLRRFQAPGN